MVRQDQDGTQRFDWKIHMILREKGRLHLTKIWPDWMRLLRCDLQILRGILLVNRQIKHLKIRTVHGILIETLLEMKEKHKIMSNYLIQNIGIPQYQ